MLRNEQETAEKNHLAAYALKNCESNGRKIFEEKDDFRLDFARDRDRIIHTKAFRRLSGKTQVFVAHSGDHFRSRLTHTLEVAQISRTLARIFSANEDVTEAVALAHDLGHTPFGHIGQEMLALKMKKFGKNFEHNAQSRRILEVLEPQNLCEETLLCLFKHPTLAEKKENDLAPQNFLEGQIVDIADEIAYTAHDIDDGIRAGILTKGDFPFFPENILDFLVKNVVENTLQNLQKHKPKTPNEIRNFPFLLVNFSADFLPKRQESKKILMEKFYKNESVRKASEEGAEKLGELFDFFLENQSHIPENFVGEKEDRTKDFVAGMTDDFAEKLWREKLFS